MQVIESGIEVKAEKPTTWEEKWADKLSAEQKAVIEAMDRPTPTLVTGMAGTGKSFLLNAIRDKFATLAVTASTGIAALNVQGMTLHSFAGLGMEPKSAEVIYRRLANRKDSTVVDTIKALKWLAIDEISMIGATLLDIVNQLFQIIRKSDRPFGGVKVIMFGDFLQLPPVNDAFAFHSRFWKDAEPETHFLTHIYRQEDEKFSQVLNMIRTGKRTASGDMPPAVCDLLHAAMTRKPDEDKPPIVLHTINADVDTENRRRLAEVEGEERVYQATEWASNDYVLNKIDKDCRAPRKLALKIGARVMLLANLDLTNSLANGSLGTVVEMDSRTVRVHFDMNDAEVDVFRHDFELVEHNVTKGARTQFPLRLAYAITVHKSQGLTMDAARINIGGNFCPPGAAYVAFSRVKTEAGLFLGTTKKGAIKASQDALEFYGLSS